MKSTQFPTVMVTALLLQMVVCITVYGARPLVISITGNTALAARTLRQAAEDDLATLRLDPASRAAADDAAFQMASVYRRQGFPDVQVSSTRKSGVDGTEEVIFTVQEGLKTVVEKLSFTGNSACDSNTLRALVQLPRGRLAGITKSDLFVLNALHAGGAAIADHYRRLGYRNIQVSEPQITAGSQPGRVAVLFEIAESARYNIAEVKVIGDCPSALMPSIEKEAAGFVGQPYIPATTLQLKSRVLVLFGTNGYPETDVKIDVDTSDPAGRVTLTATITPGDQVVIRDIIVVGADATSEAFIRECMEWPTDGVYRLSARDHAYRQLYTTGLFSHVTFDLLPGSTPQQRDLQVTVVETSSREYFIEPGWGSYELLRLRSGVRERNLFGRGRDMNIEALTSAKALRLSVGLTDPWVLGSGVSAHIPASVGRREEPAFVSDEATLGLLFSASPYKDLTFTGGWKGAIKRTPEVDAIATDIATDDNYITSLAAMQMVLDRRDDILFPRKGYRMHLSLDLADQAIGSQFNFVRLGGGLRVFVPFGADTVLALRYNTGLVLPIHGTAELPIGERFFNGGESTVRSFKTGELGPIDANGVHAGGLSASTINLELRQRLGGPVYGSIFFDLGNIAPNSSRAELNSAPDVTGSDLIKATLDDYFQDWRPAVGVGLMYALPVGPARLDVAFNPDRRSDERSFTVHLSIGVAF